MAPKFTAVSSVSLLGLNIKGCESLAHVGSIEVKLVLLKVSSLPIASLISDNFAGINTGNFMVLSRWRNNARVITRSSVYQRTNLTVVGPL